MSDAKTKHLNEKNQKKADRISYLDTTASVGAAVIPIPVADAIAIISIQILAQKY
jgi:hypothetical protein